MSNIWKGKEVLLDEVYVMISIELLEKDDVTTRIWRLEELVKMTTRFP